MTEQPKDFTSHQTLRIGQDAGRIARALAGLSTWHGGCDRTDAAANMDEPPDIPIERVRFAIRAHRLRQRYFAAPVISDPAWDMMLVLFEATLAGQSVSVLELEQWPGLSRPGAVRWFKTLVHYDLVIEKADPLDPSRMLAELSAEAQVALRCYFADVKDSPAS